MQLFSLFNSSPYTLSTMALVPRASLVHIYCPSPMCLGFVCKRPTALKVFAVKGGYIGGEILEYDRGC